MYEVKGNKVVVDIPAFRQEGIFPPTPLSLSLSPRNAKLGSIWNLSFLPLATCSESARRTCGRDCYAKGSLKIYKNAARAWAGNTRFYKYMGPLGVVTAISRFFGERNAPPPDLFRFFVAGDSPSKYFWDAIARNLCRWLPHTRFLAYTKQYDQVEQIFVGSWAVPFPHNLKLILSIHPRMSLPSHRLIETFPLAFLYDPKDPDSRIPRNALVCPGKTKTCRECQICFRPDILNNRTAVVFPIHGNGRKTPSIRETYEYIRRPENRVETSLDLIFKR